MKFCLFPKKFSQGLVAPPRLSVLLVLAFVAVSVFQTHRGLFDSTEGRYAECAREMVRTGTWLEPVLNGQPHWTKPPLTYLAIMGPLKLMGPTTEAARFFLIPCYLVTIMAVYGLSLRLWQDRVIARMCALVFATMGFPMAASNVVSTDFLLTVVLALTHACFWDAQRRSSSFMVYLTWFFLGVAFLTKGPPALLFLPAMVAVCVHRPREKHRRFRFFNPLAILLFFVVGFGWYAWEASIHPGLAHYWLRDEVINRSFSNEFDRNSPFYKNFEIYIPILIFGTLPWSAWVAWRWRSVFSRLQNLGSITEGWRNLSDAAVWLIWATVFPLGVFVFSHSKLPLYLLPLFVPIAVGMGRLLLQLDGAKPEFSKTVRTLMAIMFLLLVLFKSVGVSVMKRDKDMAVLHAQLTKTYGLVDPRKLFVFGDTHPNALSYYYDFSLPLVKKDKLEGWLRTAEGQALLYRHNQQEKDVDRLVGNRPVRRSVLPHHWRLIVVPQQASEGTRAGVKD